MGSGYEPITGFIYIASVLTNLHFDISLQDQ